MAEKLTASVTFKCTDEMKIKLERIARSRKLNGSSELMRIAAMDIIFEVEEMLNCLQMPIDLTTVTEDTRNTSDFELMPSPPLRDVTPKHTGTKKAQLREQLNLICHSTAKQ
ncbi:ribbon-helix-helix protein, CopG family [Acinetobacter baumannii]|uniref:ribbon-helix-helix protein, CopG family n=1 Tax=Acinetobacter baumannii TaxID=470 RepID=UPI00123112DB|nr:ribbon-helix-helix protein, CopG family [Acinetobacter baumannii]ELB1968687.1 ribbon-helix-helix protein, CopG family [Acinetobacter baumannii]ELB1972162.1 ribbon-helix-helix protein, CopG family [Acinetobacter baumannii]